MNLSSSEVAWVLVGCVAVIGVVVALLRRGVFAPKGEAHAQVPEGSAKK